MAEKKIRSLSPEEKKKCIDPEEKDLSIRKQADLMRLSRSSYYYEVAKENEKNLELMEMIDKKYTKHPFFGSRKITQWLQEKGEIVNRKRIQRLMRLMRLEGICPKKNLSRARKEHKKYPYLLKGVKIERSNQVWSTDITYIKVVGGFMYLTSVIDWYSRYVLSWKLSNSLDGSFCIEALEEALEKGKPGIFNTDQGVQYTSGNFTDRLEREGIQISMDGKGRALDNIFIERLWRTVKYEEIYLKEYKGIKELRKSLKNYFEFYNDERPHQSLGYQKPAEVYWK